MNTPIWGKEREKTMHYVRKFRTQVEEPRSFGQRKEPIAVDRQTYNYGRRALWAKLGPTPEYTRTRALAEALAAAAMRFSAAAWNLEMGIKHVREAEDMGERGRALAALAGLRNANDILGIDGTFNQTNMPDDPKLEEPEDYVWGENI